MRNGKSLLGLSVVGQEDGAQLGKVSDLFFDHENNQLLALVLSNKDLFGAIDATVVLWEEVQSVGKDVILVKNAASKINLGSVPAVRDSGRRETSLSGTQVISSDGQQLGTLADMCIDETTGQIEGYDVSGGFIADSLHGKKFLPAPPGAELGHDAAVVSPAAAAALKKK